MRRQTLLSWLFCTLSFAYAWTLLGAFGLNDIPGLTALVINTPPKNDAASWQTIETSQVESGATIPAATNVIFHLPDTISTIGRDVLFGLNNDEIRYWGYCFPDGYDPDNRPQTVGFPGKMFLSRAERDVRESRLSTVGTYSIYNPPTRRDLSQQVINTIRHQIEIFTGGLTCYIMTQKPLSIGSDRDGDGLNSKVEKQLRTNSKKKDTDGDGLDDGTEVRGGTNALVRDTDGDGIIDGIEDADHDGVVDTNETDPRRWDSDGDKLCDGYCQIYRNKRVCGPTLQSDCVDIAYGDWMGEDKNLNGIVDSGETDPRKWSTRGDGVSDEQRYYECLLNKQPKC
jgi:hypothetical protein